MHAAILEGSVDLVRLLLAKGGDIHQPNSNGVIPLQLIPYSPFAHDLVHMCLQKDIKLTMDICRLINSTFCEAIDKVNCFTKSAVYQLTSLAQEGTRSTFLHWAVIKNLEDLLDPLIQSGLNPKETNHVEHFDHHANSLVWTHPSTFCCD